MQFTPPQLGLTEKIFQKSPNLCQMSVSGITENKEMTRFRATRHTGWLVNLHKTAFGWHEQPKAVCRPMCACITPKGKQEPQGDNTAT